jgi:centrosomal protein CEP63
VELSSQSEIQHLNSKLERAKDTICANELEIERLNIRVNDLMGTNMTILQDHRQKEEKLRESEKLLEVCVRMSNLGRYMHALGLGPGCPASFLG